MFGYDYGLPERIMTLADIEYPKLIGEAECVGFAYGMTPEIEQCGNVPFACLICRNISSVAKAFEHFKEWIKGSGGKNEALQVTLVRLKAAGYKMCIYPTQELLVKRCIPYWLEDDMEPVFFIPCYIKGFDSHGAYEPLKQLARAHPVLLCYGDVRTGVPEFKEGILLPNMKFMHQDEVSQNSMEISAVRDLNLAKEEMPKPPKRKIASVEDNIKIKKRRIRRLKSHFPVTLEYLKVNSGFLDTADTLMKEGYIDWQIKQAACNIILSMNLTGTQTFENIDQGKASNLIAEYFLNKRESPLKACPSSQCFDSDVVRNQIVCDQKKLMQEFIDIAQTMKPNELQIEMSKLGLL